MNTAAAIRATEVDVWTGPSDDLGTIASVKPNDLFLGICIELNGIAEFSTAEAQALVKAIQTVLRSNKRARAQYESFEKLQKERDGQT